MAEGNRGRPSGRDRWVVAEGVIRLRGLARSSGVNQTRTSFIPALGRNSLTWLYDPVVALTTREAYFKKELLRQASIPEDAFVLDLGCGTGTLAVLLARSCPNGSIVGLDGDETALRRARRKADACGVRVHLDHGLAPALPYSANSFDRVLSSLFFHHLDRSRKAETARAVLRVLRPGGQFHVADWGKPTGRVMRMLFYSVQLLDGFETTSDNVEGLLPGILEAAGFRNVRVNREIRTVCGTLTLYSAVKS